MNRAQVWLCSLALLSSALGGCAIPIIGAHTHSPTADRATPTQPRGARPHARAAPTTPEQCYAQLQASGAHFERLAPASADGVPMPLRMQGPLGGVTVAPRSGSAVHAVLDCRFALALLAWTPTLAHAGVTRLEHYSIYRPGARIKGRGRPSGHARGMAIDAARFYMRDGGVIDVLTDWEDRDHDEAPCPLRRDESRPSRLLRSMVCDAVQRGLFQVVLTPHHDRAHRNHVHLELRPEVSWTYVR